MIFNDIGMDTASLAGPLEGKLAAFDLGFIVAATTSDRQGNHRG